MLAHFGWNSEWAAAFAAVAKDSWIPGRILAVHRGMCEVSDVGRAALRGRLADEPVVGDWVAVGPERAIELIVPRRGLIARRAVGKGGAAQPIAANVDKLLVVTTPDADFSPRRVERYLAIAWDGGASPVVVLAKTDLVDDVAPFVRALEAVAPAVRCVSALTGDGMDALRSELGEGVTAALVGSSGVGKSTLVNALAGARQAVSAVRAGDGKGRHTTTARELLLLPSGGVLIDTPGMREVGLIGGDEALATTFGDIDALAAACRFRDCRHDGDAGCAVDAAIASGALAHERLVAFRKLSAEQAYEAGRRDPRHARQEKARARNLQRGLRARARNEPKLRDD